MMRPVILALALLCAGAVQAADCTAEAATAARGSAWAAWSSPATATAGTSVATAPALAPGSAANVRLLPNAEVRFVAPPGKAGDGYGGIIAFAAPEAGRYRVALQVAGWLDVLVNGKSVASTGHGHGPECSGIRKIVDFDLPAGNHLIQIAGAPAAQAVLMVIRAR